jgi:hypothetical protein
MFRGWPTRLAIAYAVWGVVAAVLLLIFWPG